MAKVKKVREDLPKTARTWHYLGRDGVVYSVYHASGSFSWEHVYTEDACAECPTCQHKRL